MSTQRIYALPVEVTDWKFDGATDIQFNWEYDDGSSALPSSYSHVKDVVVWPSTFHCVCSTGRR